MLLLVCALRCPRATAASAAVEGVADECSCWSDGAIPVVVVIVGGADARSCCSTEVVPIPAVFVPLVSPNAVLDEAVRSLITVVDDDGRLLLLLQFRRYGFT